MDNVHNHARSSMNVRLLFARPVFGPFFVGLLFGGVPLGIAFGLLGGDVNSPNLLGRGVQVTPLAIIIAAIAAAWGTRTKVSKLFRRALMATIGECIPLPLFACTVASLNAGYDVFSPQDFPVLLCLLSFWAAGVTVAAFCAAAIYQRVRFRHL